MIHDINYLLWIAPAFLLALIAQGMVRSAYAQTSQIPARMSGFAAARHILDSWGLQEVTIEQMPGHLSDHYDPRHKVLRLSGDISHGRTMAAVGIAAHEAGHALQHAASYGPLVLRTAMVPITAVGSNLSLYIIMFGFILGMMTLIKVGIVLFALVVVFALVTLPVERNATTRAKRLMVSTGIVSPSEERSAGAVLDAAFLTYVASALSAVMTLLYYLYRSGLLGGRR